ncbi:hypothetical protein [Tenacibaculum phage PTm5]|uniref:Uncharacterized protein n=1 Tax=Tenacibaculum phage PTm5 TaxID=2547426 RepID=A0A5S9HXT0_9CAUD|nr:hypothetical protein [Tenacibaculum phage PTm5]
MGDFAKDVDFHGNKIKRAKVDIPNRNSIANDDAIDKQYVDDVDKYTTTTSSNTGVQPTNIVTDRTLIHNKPSRELFDLIFYPIIKAKYIKPTFTATTRFVQVGTNTAVTPEVGMLVDVKFDITTTLNDSQGLDANKYQLSGSGITGTISGIDDGVAGYTISNYIIQENNTWQLTQNYKQANVKNDSRGNADATGDPTAPYFNASTQTQTINNVVKWVWYGVALNGDISSPSNTTIGTLLSSGKKHGDVPTEAKVSVPSGGTQTIYFAIPINGISIPQLTATKDGSMPVTASFTGTLLTDVPDATNSGNTKNYALYRATNGNGFAQVAEYVFKTQ